MSEYNMLVNGLRERAEHAATEGNMTATCDARYFTQSADAIRALEAEVERLKGVLEEVKRLSRLEDGVRMSAINQLADKTLEAKP